MMDIGEHQRQWNAVLAPLPRLGDPSPGLTRKELNEYVPWLKPARLGGYLQTLKHQGKVRCYRGHWRRTS